MSISIKDQIDCKHLDTRELRPKIYDYNMNPPEHILITTTMVLCLICGEKVKSAITIVNIISYCDKQINPLCDGIIREGQETKDTEECSLCVKENEK